MINCANEKRWLTRNKPEFSGKNKPKAGALRPFQMRKGGGLFLNFLPCSITIFTNILLESNSPAVHPLHSRFFLCQREYASSQRWPAGPIFCIDEGNRGAARRVKMRIRVHLDLVYATQYEKTTILPWVSAFLQAPAFPEIQQ